MIDGLVREVNRVAGERDRDVGHQVQPANRRRQRERRDHVVRSLEGEDPLAPASRKALARSIASIGPNSAVMKRRESLIA